jgi:DNA-directed RNA polymerase specialized sigma24 family protein
LQLTTKYTEEELIYLLQQKNQTAFAYLYDNYSAALNSVIIKMVDDTQLSEDILQETFVKIWNNFGQYDANKGRLFTWMINITRNLTIDTLRSKGYKNYYGSMFDTIGLKKQVQLLKPDQKIIIDLAYFNGYTQEEISKEMSIPLGTVKTRMRAAIIELRKLLQF